MTEIDTKIEMVYVLATMKWGLKHEHKVDHFMSVILFDDLYHIYSQGCKDFFKKPNNLLDKQSFKEIIKKLNYEIIDGDKNRYNEDIVINVSAIPNDKRRKDYSTLLEECKTLLANNL